jgi:hypothetical protein
LVQERKADKALKALKALNRARQSYQVSDEDTETDTDQEIDVERAVQVDYTGMAGIEEEHGDGDYQEEDVQDGGLGDSEDDLDHFDF